MIKPFERKDLKAVMAIWLETMIQSHPFLPSDYYLKGYHDFQKEQLLTSQITTYWHENELVAFISVSMDLTVQALCVKEKYQRVQIGRKLVDHVLKRLGRLHAIEFKENKAFEQFLKKEQFEFIKDIKDSKTKKDKYIYQKTLLV